MPLVEKATIYKQKDVKNALKAVRHVSPLQSAPYVLKDTIITKTHAKSVLYTAIHAIIRHPVSPVQLVTLHQIPLKMDAKTVTISAAHA